MRLRMACIIASGVVVVPVVVAYSVLVTAYEIARDEISRMTRPPHPPSSRPR